MGQQDAKEGPVMQDDTMVDLGLDLVRQVNVWREALLQRMLRHWNPAWGVPVLVEQAPTFEPGGRMTQRIIGLQQEGPFGEFRPVLVHASDHASPNGSPLPAEGPWPLPDPAQFAAWRAAKAPVCG